MTARVGVITFPGSLDDRDAARAVRLAGAEAVPLWHSETSLAGVDAVTLHTAPGEGTHVVLDKRIHWESPLARTA